MRYGYDSLLTGLLCDSLRDIPISPPSSSVFPYLRRYTSLFSLVHVCRAISPTTTLIPILSRRGRNTTEFEVQSLSKLNTSNLCLVLSLAYPFTMKITKLLVLYNFMITKYGAIYFNLKDSSDGHQAL